MTTAAGSEASGFRPWKEGIDEAVFIAFNPLFRLANLRSDQFVAARQKLMRGFALNAPELRGLVPQLLNDQPPPEEEPYAGLTALMRWIENEAKHRSEIVGWAELQAATGVSDVRDFALAFEGACMMGGLVGDPKIVAALDAYIDEHGLFPPRDQELQPSLEKRIGQVFQNAGCDVVKCSDVVNDRVFDLAISDLIDGPSILAAARPKPYAFPPASLTCEDVGIACYVGFDSVVTVFRGKTTAMRASNIDALLEGIWASSEDNPMWDYSWVEGLWPERGGETPVTE